MKDINNIIERIKKKLVNAMNIDVFSLIKVPSNEELEAITNLYKTYSYSNSMYDENELLNLSNYNVPQIVIDFYEKFSTAEGIELGGDVKFLSLEGIRRENSELTPGALLIKYGLLTIATTTGGNVLCMDLNTINDGEPSVLIADRTIFADKKIIIYKNGSVIKENLSYEVIRKYAVEINNTFTGFLEMLINEEIDDIEEYLD